MLAFLRLTLWPMLADTAKKIPRQVWLGLVAALLALALVAWHQHVAHKAIAAAEKRGEDRAYAKITQQAQALAKRANDRAAKIRKQTDEANRTSIALANDLRVRGPGKAACTATAATSTSRHVSPPRPADAAVDQVPAGGGANLIAMPFDDAVAWAEQHDLNLNEVKGWRAADQQQREAAEQQK
jgi:hypothetical protein